VINIVKQETQYFSPKNSMMIIVIGSLIGCLLLLGTICGIIYWRYKLHLKKDTYKVKGGEKNACEEEQIKDSKRENNDEDDMNFEY
jgi:uncharacterized membrane protein YciS (DUF1049 family)